jgi:hypothetical protein
LGNDIENQKILDEPSHEGCRDIATFRHAVAGEVHKVMLAKDIC